MAQQHQQQQQQNHPIFFDIYYGDLAAVQQRVLADAAVLEERESAYGGTPLMFATARKKLAIALFLIQHRGQHDVDTTANNGQTALHYASASGLLEMVQALVAAGANPAALNQMGSTPLMYAGFRGQTDIVAFLLQLPAVKASIDAMDQVEGQQDTALSLASSAGHKRIVQLLLDAGADPTIPAGDRSPLNQALSDEHHAIAAILRHAIAEADRIRALHKARSLVGNGAAALACLQGRVEQGQALPLLVLITLERHQQQQQQLQQYLLQLQQLQQLQQLLQECQEHQRLLQLQQLQQDLEQLLQQWQGDNKERLRAAAAFAVGVSGGEKDTGLCEDLYLQLLEYMLPLWADKGLEA